MALLDKLEEQYKRGSTIKTIGIFVRIQKQLEAEGIPFTQEDGCYKCFANMHRIYKQHADAIFNQTGASGPEEYWERIASNPKIKSAKK